MTDQTRAADRLVDSLIMAGTDTVFSLSGNQIMSIYDAAIGKPLRIVHARHEGGAVYMADGYSRASGKVGVALVTAAPGFTNALGPLYPVMQSQIPLLLLSGDSPTNRDSMGAFQEFDQSLTTRGLVKESWRCTNPERLPLDIAGGIRMAQSGRPGPVHIALPEDMLNETTAPADTNALEFNAELSPLSQADLHAILSMLDNASNPLIITGPSLSETCQPGLTRKAQDALQIPVITMQSPRGLNDPALGDLRSILKAADQIVLIDKDVDFTLGFGDEQVMPCERIAMVAAEADSIARASNLISGRLEWGCLGDPVSALNALIEANTVKGPKAWMESVTAATRKRPPHPKEGETATAPAILNAMNAVITEMETPPILIIDGGEFGQWSQSILPTEQMHINGLSGAIGGSIPQAVGAAMANPGRRVIALLGDGTAGFHFMEIEIARKYDLPITFIIGNDYRWGAEVEIQKRQFGANRMEGCMLDATTRYDRMASAVGAKGVMAEDTASFVKALTASFNGRKPVVINTIIEGLPAPTF